MREDFAGSVTALPWYVVQVTSEGHYPTGPARWTIVAEDGKLRIAIVENLPSYLARHIVEVHNLSLQKTASRAQTSP